MCAQLLRLRTEAPAFQARELKQQRVDLALTVMQLLFVAGEGGANDNVFEQGRLGRLPQGGDIVTGIQFGQIHA